VNKLLLATVGDVSMPGGSLLADPCTIPTLLAGLNAKVLAGLVLALTGLTVMGAMFFVRKWLWRYLGVHATDRLQRLGSAGLLVAVLGVSSAIFGAETGWIHQQIPEPWLRIAASAAAAALGALALLAIADLIWGRNSLWGRRVRIVGSGLAALGLASVLLVQAAAAFHLDEKLGSIPRLKEIGSIQRFVQIFSR
jgi:hypothetical protein